jgi:hypothetical protein
MFKREMDIMKLFIEYCVFVSVLGWRELSMVNM